MLYLFLLNAHATKFGTPTTSSTKFNPSIDLPQTGEVALGFNAAPILDFALNSINIMNDTGDKSRRNGYLPNRIRADDHR